MPANQSIRARALYRWKLVGQLPRQLSKDHLEISPVFSFVRANVYFRPAKVFYFGSRRQPAQDISARTDSLKLRNENSLALNRAECYRLNSSLCLASAALVQSH